MKILTLVFLLVATTASAQSSLSRVARGQEPGIIIRPGQDIQTIINQNGAGSTYIIAAGLYRLTAAIVPKAGDKIVGEKTRGITRLATISGARVLAGPWTQTTNGAGGTVWWIGGQTQQGPVHGDPLNCKPGWERCIYPEQVWFNGNVQKIHANSLALTTTGFFFFDYAADRIYVADNPNGQTVETSIIANPFSAANANVTIRGLIIEKFANENQTGALVLGTNWLADDNEVRYNHGAGIAMASPSHARGNYVHHNCNYAFIGGGSFLIDNNEWAYNNMLSHSNTQHCGYEEYWGAGGTKFVFANNAIIRHNFVHHNHGPGIWSDIHNIDVLYEDNLIEDNVRAGIFHEISCRSVIRNNYINRNGSNLAFAGWTDSAGIQIYTSPDVEVYGNVLVDNWQGITGLHDDRRGQWGADVFGPEFVPPCIWNLANMNIHNNIIFTSISAPGGGRSGVIDTFGNNEAFTLNNRYLGNDYFLGASPNYFIWLNVDQNEFQWVAFGMDTPASGGSFTR